MAKKKNIFKIIKSGSVEELETYVLENPDCLHQQAGYWSDRRTPLLDAIHNGKETMALKLLELGADPNAVDDQERNALHYAAGYRREGLVRKILETNIDIDIDKQTGNRQTALYLAVASGDIRIVRMIIDADASLDIRGPDGWTALHQAADKCFAEIYKLLLESGADRTIRSNAGNTTRNFDTSKEIIGYYDTVQPIEEPEAVKQPETQLPSPPKGEDSASEDTAESTEDTDGNFVRENRYMVSITEHAPHAGLKITSLYNFNAETITTVTESAKTQSTVIAHFSEAASKKQLKQAYEFLEEQNNQKLAVLKQSQPIV